jgi:hypothetical protein
LLEQKQEQEGSILSSSTAMSSASYQDFLGEDNGGGTSDNGDEDDLWWEDDLLDCFTETGCDNDDSEHDSMIDNTLRLILLHATQQGNNNADCSVAALQGQGAEDEQSSCTSAAAKNHRRPKRTALWTDQDGTRRPILPRQTLWYNAYVLHPDIENPQFQKGVPSTVSLALCTISRT